MRNTMKKVEKIKEELEQPLGEQAFHHTMSDEMTTGQKPVDAQKLADALMKRSVMESLKERREKDYLTQIQQESEALRKNVAANNQIYLVNYYRELEGNKLVVFVKKAIRKVLYFLLQPVIDEQNRFNASVTQSLNEMYAVTEKQTAVLQQQRQTIIRLQKRCEKLEDRLERVEKELHI